MIAADEYFVLKLLTSFIAGGLWVTLATLIAEHFGSRVGGVLGGFPSTVLLSLLFLGMTESPDFVVKATTVFPLTFAINAVFTITFAVLIFQGLGLALLGAGLSWLTLQMAAILLLPRHFGLSLMLWAILFLMAYQLLESVLKLHSHQGMAIKYQPLDLLARALLSGSAIALTVLMGKLGGPVVGSLFASFPAVFVSTLIVAYQVGGPTFARALVKPLTLSGLLNCVVYAIAVRYSYPRFGLAAGTLIATGITVVCTYGTYRWIRGRLS